MIGNRGSSLALVGLGILAWMALAKPADSTIPAAATQDSDGQLQVMSAVLPTGVQQVVMVDTEAKTMAVYQIDPTQAKIQLKSVRNVIWDLRMEQFNGQAPLPSELRQLQPAAAQ